MPGVAVRKTEHASPSCCSASPPTQAVSSRMRWRPGSSAFPRLSYEGLGLSVMLNLCPFPSKSALDKKNPA